MTGALRFTPVAAGEIDALAVLRVEAMRASLEQRAGQRVPALQANPDRPDNPATKGQGAPQDAVTPGRSPNAAFACASSSSSRLRTEMSCAMSANWPGSGL